ncbi:hypothetical protein ABOM_011722 [Aspergillus bombycis]|uniref:Uncharacterized protein n=1 Tax=Aspergillus bombycis TaxID=109264 RepID=A0A1F7ZLY8_9EURO|nr:hypothetical protein ABOM_011722 [Aspergillus bombycis]OGM40319.1 hypothetical protein ABOM_011722 [Aspergillus bombycis]
MKFTLATLTAVALAPLAAADFYIYSIKSGSAIFMSSLGDVSGGKHGVCCKGCPDFEELEFNSKIGHYKPGLRSVHHDDKKVGQCQMDKSDHFQCGNPSSQAGDSIVHYTALRTLTRMRSTNNDFTM